MKERIKKIRRALELTQHEFATKIGTTANVLTNYETGRRNPSASVINNICKTFNVSENWLRTGEGEMFVPINVEKQLMEWAGKVFGGKEENFKKRFITMLMGLNEREWEFLEEKAKQLAGLSEKNLFSIQLASIDNSSFDTQSDDDIDQQVAEYRRYLELEREAEEKSSVSRRNT